MANVEPAKRAQALILEMDRVARQACTSAGRDVILYNGGAQKILQISHERLAPNAVDAIHREVVRFLHFVRADQKMEASWLEFDVLRRKSESRMAMGGGLSPMASPPSDACKMRRRPITRSLWFWPVLKARWFSQRWRNRCVDFAEHAGVSLDKTFWSPRT